MMFPTPIPLLFGLLNSHHINDLISHAAICPFRFRGPHFEPSWATVKSPAWPGARHYPPHTPQSNWNQCRADRTKLTNQREIGTAFHGTNVPIFLSSQVIRSQSWFATDSPEAPHLYRANVNAPFIMVEVTIRLRPVIYINFQLTFVHVPLLVHVYKMKLRTLSAGQNNNNRGKKRESPTSESREVP